jgi:hypothetical protein
MTFAELETELAEVINQGKALTVHLERLNERRLILEYKLAGMKNHLLNEIRAKPNSNVAIILAEVEKS